jgi:hypothetical protein
MQVVKEEAAHESASPVATQMRPAWLKVSATTANVDVGRRPADSWNALDHPVSPSQGHRSVEGEGSV